jgi:hypothetical protein
VSVPGWVDGETLFLGYCERDVPPETNVTSLKKFPGPDNLLMTLCRCLPGVVGKSLILLLGLWGCCYEYSSCFTADSIL